MANRKLKTPPNRTRKAGTKRQHLSTSAGNIVQRPDTDDPSQMMPQPAEAACGPLVDPILEDEDDSDDETPGFGDTP